MLHLASLWRHEITFANVHDSNDDARFCDGPRMLICEATKPCIKSGWIALLINTWIRAG